MAFLSSMDISGSALTAERYRMDVILQNLANANTPAANGEEPYKRKQVIFQERPLSFQDQLCFAAQICEKRRCAYYPDCGE